MLLESGECINRNPQESEKHPVLSDAGRGADLWRLCEEQKHGNPKEGLCLEQAEAKLAYFTSYAQRQVQPGPLNDVCSPFMCSRRCHGTQTSLPACHVITGKVQL